MTIGTHAVAITADRDNPNPVDLVDVSCYVDELTIEHGRESPTDQPDASTVTIGASWTAENDALPAIVEIGNQLRVTTTVGGVTFVRFVGQITDVTTGWEEVGEDTPDRPVAQILAAGMSAVLARRVVGAEPFPQELDGARVSRVFALAGVTLDGLTSDPGTVQILPRDVDRQPALDVAQETADDAAGVVWYTRTGKIRYADTVHRKNAPVALALDACDVLVTPTWRRTTEGLLNTLTLAYGAPPEGGEQPTVYATNPGSIDRFGLYEASTSTQLAALDDAQAFANLQVARAGRPVWNMTDLPVDVEGLDEARTKTLLDLDMHALVSLTGLPAAGSAPTATSLFVEGWTERLAWGLHEIQLHVSGYCRTVPPPQWDEIPPTTTWDTIRPTGMTWDDVACLGPPTVTGRWNDVAASLRWDTTDPGVTWDTWEG